MTTQHSKACTGGKPFLIPMGNHVLLLNHPEGHNKILDRYKPDIYVVVGHHQKPYVYYIQLLNSDHKEHPKVVNHCQLYDLNQSCLPSESLGSEPGGIDVPAIPSFLTVPNSKSNILNFTEPIVQHHYNTRSKLKTAATNRQVVVETQITHL